MSDALEQFLEAVAEGEAPPFDEAVFGAVRHLLRLHLRASGRLALPPAFLGLPRGVGWDQALDELAVDAFACVIATPDYIRDWLADGKPAIGFAAMRIRQFINRRHQACDPVGAAVFTNTVGAVRIGVENATVVVADARVDGSTMARFPRAPADSEPPAELPVPDGHPWWDEEVVRLMNRPHLAARRALAAHLDWFEGEGVASFVVGRLANALKPSVRSWHAHAHATPAEALAVDVDADEPAVVPRVEPQQEALLWLTGGRGILAVTEAIERRVRGPRRKRLHLAWRMLVEARRAEADLPGQAELARLLNVSRATISADFVVLRNIVRLVLGDEAN